MNGKAWFFAICCVLSTNGWWIALYADVGRGTPFVILPMVITVIVIAMIGKQIILRWND